MNDEVKHSAHFDKEISDFSSKSSENQAKALWTSILRQINAGFFVKVHSDKSFYDENHGFSSKSIYICHRLHAFRERDVAKDC